ncbi:MAG: hypothetical protein K6F94_05995 [Bacteroidaceae bacterium]|nr:hypothetical protein [Bacteroidaceae bacterium]
MNRTLLLILLSFTFLCGNARKFELGKHRFKLSRTDFVDTIQIFTDHRQQILIPVNIEGKRRVFKLDTGSGFGMIYENGAIRHSSVLGSVKSVDGAGQSSSVRTVTIPPFTIGSLEISDYVMTEAKASVLSNSFRHDAVIGFALFNQGLAAKIDMAAKQLIITDRKHFFDSERGESVKYETYHYAPYLNISPHQGVKLKTLFDTGCNDIYLLNCKDYDKHRKKLAPVTSEILTGRIGIANDGVEVESEIAFLHLDDVMWQKLKLSDIEARTHQGATCFGRELLRYGSIIINPFRKILLFQPYPRQDDFPAFERRQQPEDRQNQQPTFERRQQPEDRQNQQPTFERRQQPEDRQSQQPTFARHKQPGDRQSQQPTFERRQQSGDRQSQQANANRNHLIIGNSLPDIYYIPKNHNVVVGLIRTSSPLYKAGLHRGDIILGINGKPVDFHSFITYPWLKGVTYTLSVKDVLGFQKEVVIKK